MDKEVARQLMIEAFGTPEMQFTNHVLERMAERNVSVKQVFNCIRNGDIALNTNGPDIGYRFRDAKYQVVVAMTQFPDTVVFNIVTAACREPIQEKLTRGAVYARGAPVQYVKGHAKPRGKKPVSKRDRKLLADD